MSGCAALILAGGSGVRLGGEVPKQYLPLAGRPVLRHSIEILTAHAAIGAPAAETARSPLGSGSKAWSRMRPRRC